MPGTGFNKGYSMSMTVLAIAEQKDGKLSSISYELITAAQKIGGELITVILAENADSLAADLASHGAGKVLAVTTPALKYFNDEIYAAVVSGLIRKYNPKLVIGPATSYGKSLMGRLAALNDAAMASDIVNLHADGDRVIVSRPAYGGNVIFDLSGAEDKIFFATIRPKIFDESKEGTGEGEVVSESPDDAVFQSKTVVQEMVVESGSSVNITEADTIVAAGRGIRGKENLPMIQELADSLGAAVGASRAIVDADWIAYRHQVGQTGKTVNPKLYITAGISGAIQHLVGMQTSKTIVAINRDKEAPIFKVATYGIVGDIFEIVPALTKRIQAGG